MSETKRALRSRMIAVRARLSADERAAAAHAVAERVEHVARVRAARVVALYAAMGAEVDAGALAPRLRARGVAVVWPRARAGERRLAFALAEPAELVAGPLGALEPPAGAREVALDDIDCFVVPGVAFSEDGHRLGRGGGYYDATLGLAPRAARVGLAYDAQLVPTLPTEPHDAAMDAVVTEARTLLFDRGGAATPGDAA
jgi:5-formyltetrahydrofolate cyclo-ligase